jgi:murein DD-endopeptidase MepM/ murein hydrolase activator NlpD
MAEYQIILLPKVDYYNWVAATREYVVRYHANLTSDLEVAGRHMYPNQVITLVDFPQAYGRNVTAWFRQNYPEARLDVIEVLTPAELENTLHARVSIEDRFGNSGKSFRLMWPTDYPKINQSFGVNQHLYRRWGLPGHEGLDIRAPMRSGVYACASGTVYRVHDGSGSHPYGIHVRLRHQDGYRTIYAHLHRTLVAVGQHVKAGEQIGLANSTGNSTGSHLHLTLKKEGASAAGMTNYPSDIIDPTPFLHFPEDETQLPGKSILVEWEHNMCLIGVHGRADGPLLEPDFPVIRDARVEAVKLLSNAPPDNVKRLLDINKDMFVLVRLFAGFRDRKVSSADFVSWVESDVQQLYQQGVRYFEVHNEPNLQIEGWQHSWKDGHQFADWFLEVVERLKAHYPEALFGYPGLSPGHEIPGQRMNAWVFLQQSELAALASDWIGCHCYWINDTDMMQASGGLVYEEFRRIYPEKLLFITEFSNPFSEVTARSKGQQYVDYYRRLRNVKGLGAAFSFVLSASSNFPHEVWRGEDGQVSDIAQLIGNRNF